MEDELDASDQLRERCWIQQVARNPLQLEPPHCPVVGAQQHPHLVPARQKGPHKVRPDVPRRPGHRDAQARSFGPAGSMFGRA